MCCLLADFVVRRSGTCKWALDVVWLRAECGTVFWWHFKCVCSSMKMCLLIHASDLFTCSYSSYSLRAAGGRHCLMPHRVNTQHAHMITMCKWIESCRQGSEMKDADWNKVSLIRTQCGFIKRPFGMNRKMQSKENSFVKITPIFWKSQSLAIT